METSEDARYFDFGDFRFDIPRNELLHKGEPVLLSPKTLQLLRYLLTHRGRIIRKEELLENIWPDCFVDETNLTQHIYRIRKALKTEAVLVETIPKYGYRFSGEVVESSAAEPPAITESALPERATNDGLHFREPATASALHSGRAHRFVLPPDREVKASTGLFGRILVALAITSIAGFGFVLYQRSFYSENSTSVTVLPFRQLGSQIDPKLGAGLTDTLISEIAQNDRLEIVPVESLADLYRNVSLYDEPIETGKRLGVDIVITGTIQTEHGLARVNLKFYDVKKDRQYCSAKFDREYTDAFVLQDAIAERAAEKLKYEMDRHDKDSH